MCIVILAIRKEWRNTELKKSIESFLGAGGKNASIIVADNFQSVQEAKDNNKVGILYLDMNFASIDQAKQIRPSVSEVILIGTDEDMENATTDFLSYTILGLQKSLAQKRVASTQRTFVPALEQTQEQIEAELAPSSLKKLRKRNK